MLNMTYYEPILQDLWDKGRIAIVNNRPCECAKTSCDTCQLNGDILSPTECHRQLTYWLTSEHDDSKIDWTLVPKDAKILVTLHGHTFKAHFAEYSEKYDSVAFYHEGRTSYTSTEGCYDYVKSDHAHLYEEGENT